MADPDQVLIVGDWHANALWAKAVIGHVPRILPEARRVIVHTGDFGVWPNWDHGTDFLNVVDAALDEVDAELWFVDGNHEDHAYLTMLMQQRPVEERRTTPYPIRDRIMWLPRGYRWRWHDRTWLALGGATSVDRKLRTVGVDWFANESIHHSDYIAAVDRGHADVMVTHDCPQGVRLRTPKANPGWWNLGPAEEHRRLLLRITEHVQPGWLFHGHYHLFHDDTINLGWGPLRVVGLDCDGAYAGQSVVCDVRDMTITNPWAGCDG